MFGGFPEIISDLWLTSYVKSRERLVFGYFGLFCLNRWFFTALRSLVKRSCLEIS